MEKPETTWVIGDIHGMYDPIKRLITELRKREILSGEKIRKIIFIGDYIDYGPSSKEVLDLLMSLEYETVFLAGNHEDLLLHYCKKSYFYEEYGNMWFNGNGGQDTVLSFNPDPEVYKKVQLHPVEYHHSNSRNFEPGDYTFEKKYMDFFNNLVYSHVEEFDLDGEQFKFAFSHAGLDASRNLEEQLALKTYDEFHDYVQKNNIFMKNFNLWSREEPTQKLGDYIVVQGHTPTELLPEYYKNVGTYKPKSGLPYFKFIDPQVRSGHDNWPDTYYLDGDFKDLISINIDTGAALGKYLTAIGFTSAIRWDRTIKVMQVACSIKERARQAELKNYQIRVNLFGDRA
ncbi:MAG TPA: metallophosphoesterase [Candidatus Deferrimicrobium sp.]|nr:metallophosphoesterase [Candidatus Deferrimicrobium sp.]